MTPQPANALTPRIAVVVSRYNATVTDRLLEGAIAEAERRTGFIADIWHAPGSFELPRRPRSRKREVRRRSDARLHHQGETTHDQHIANAVAGSYIVEVSLKHGIPVTLGVLTVNTPEQASERAGGKHGNKGADAMGALIDVLSVIGRARSITALENRPSQTFAIASTINDKASGSV
ncbi:MAG: 6,7-dimethyl-8-ribityllumazine synthase [Phycisphaeraceae bacterium]|nr:6,7-dimethyl-8-ribityllumazine synthase [Phycisphaeraceae bacterium]